LLKEKWGSARVNETVQSNGSKVRVVGKWVLAASTHCHEPEMRPEIVCIGAGAQAKTKSRIIDGSKVFSTMRP
jgi:hypothetical protein